MTSTAVLPHPSQFIVFRVSLCSLCFSTSKSIISAMSSTQAGVADKGTQLYALALNEAESAFTSPMQAGALSIDTQLNTVAAVAAVEAETDARIHDVDTKIKVVVAATSATSVTSVTSEAAPTAAAGSTTTAVADETCPVCLDNAANVACVPCKHVFCSKCIRTIRQYNPKNVLCPCCRQQVKAILSCKTCSLQDIEMLQDIVDVLQDDKFAGNAIMRAAAKRIKEQRAYFAPSTTKQKNAFRLYELLAKFVGICKLHDLEREYYTYHDDWRDWMYQFSKLVGHSEVTLREAVRLGNDELEEKDEEDEEDEEEDDEDHEDDEESLDNWPDDDIITELVKGSHESVAHSIMLAAATEITQLRPKADACYESKENIAQMFEHLDSLHDFIDTYTIEHISDAFEKSKLEEVLREAKRVRNDSAWYYPK